METSWIGASLVKSLIKSQLLQYYSFTVLQCDSVTVLQYYSYTLSEGSTVSYLTTLSITSNPSSMTLSTTYNVSTVFTCVVSRLSTISPVSTAASLPAQLMGCDGETAASPVSYKLTQMPARIWHWIWLLIKILRKLPGWAPALEAFFLVAPSSSRSLVVGPSVGPSVQDRCEKVTFRVSNGYLNPPNLFIYQARESLAWSQQGFWQPIFCRKHNLWTLCFDGRTKVKCLCIASMEKRKVETSPFFIPIASWCFPFPPGRQ